MPNTETLDARRADLADKLAALQGELGEIDAAIDLRDLEAAEQRRREDEAGKRPEAQALLEEEQRRLQAIADAETATRALADAVNRALSANARMVSLAQALSPNGKVPLALSATDLMMRLAAHVSSVMSTVRDSKGRRGWLGPIEWKGVHSAHPLEQSWREDEARRIAAGVQPLIEKGRT